MLFWFLCENEVYTNSLFNKIVLKVFTSKHFTIPWVKIITQNREDTRFFNKNTSSSCLDFHRREPSSGLIIFLAALNKNLLSQQKRYTALLVSVWKRGLY
jgi:hypothetical protein